MSAWFAREGLRCMGPDRLPGDEPIILASITTSAAEQPGVSGEGLWWSSESDGWRPGGNGKSWSFMSRLPGDLADPGAWFEREFAAAKAAMAVLS